VLARNDWDLDLLQIVKDDFATINVNMTIKSVDPATWTSIARTAHNVDAMSFGYTDLGNSFEPTPMLGNFLTGQSSNIGHVSDPDYDALYAKVVGSSTTDEFKTYFSNAARLVAEQHFVISLLPPTTYAFCQPWLKGYNGQRFAADFSQNSPPWGGFYLARFWVDSTVKTK
jgi:ABC-type transport system substrate-binding protein